MDSETSCRHSCSRHAGNLGIFQPGGLFFGYAFVFANVLLPEPLSNRTQVAVVLPSVIVAVLYIYLVRENKRRNDLAAQGRVTKSGVVEETTEQGDKMAHAVDNNQLDLTDRENLAL